MHPSDNSVIRTVKCLIGNKSIGRSTVIKDNFTFGIREINDTNKIAQSYQSRDEREKSNPGCEFWCTLEDPSVKFYVENVKDNREDSSGAAATITYQEGLSVKFLPSMEILQTRNDTQRSYTQKQVDVVHEIKDKSQIEVKRVITKHGTVIRYMKNGSIQLLLANGNYSIYDSNENTWTKTNNSGDRSVYKMDKHTGKVISVTQIEPLAIENNIDPETNTNVYIRADKVMTIYYNDGSTLVMHHDQTQILQRAEKVETYVEKPGYAPIRIRFNAVKFRAQTIIGMGGTNALMGVDDIMERSHDGYILETHLPDKTLVQTYREKQQLEGYNNYSHNTIHLIRRPDFAILKVKQDGEVVVITSNQRAKLNDLGYATDLGKDKDYFFELYGLESDRRSGVYTCNVTTSTIKTTDDESNEFIVYADGESVEKLSVTFNLDETAESRARKKPNSPRNLPDGEYIEEECKFLVPPKSVMEPRLIFIKNDESGYEFFSENQLEYFFRVRDVDTEPLKEQQDVYLGTEKATLITSLRLIKPREPQSLIAKIAEIPQNVHEAVQTVCIPSEPVKKMYIKDKLIQFTEFIETDIDKFEDSMDRYFAHKRYQVEESKRLEVNEASLDFRTPEKVLEEMKFFYRILKMQGKRKKHMTPVELKIWNMRSEFSDTEGGDDDLYSTDEEDASH